MKITDSCVCPYPHGDSSVRRMALAARDLGFTWQYLVQRGALTITGEQVRLPRLCADGISTAQLAAWMSVFASRGGTRLTNKIFGAIRKHRRGLAYG